MTWKELMVIKEVRDNITKAVEEQFEELSSRCTHQGPATLANWMPCTHGRHEYNNHSYQMCRWDYCPRLRR